MVLVVVGRIEEAVAQKIQVDLISQPRVAQRKRYERRLLVDQQYVECRVITLEVLGDGQPRPATADHHHARAFRLRQ